MSLYNGLRSRIFKELKGTGTSELSFRYIEPTVRKDGSQMTMIEYNTSAKLSTECRTKYEETALQEINASIFKWEYELVDSYYNDKDRLTFYGFFKKIKSKNSESISSSESVLDGLDHGIKEIKDSSNLTTVASEISDNSGLPNISSDSSIDGTPTYQD